jgi:hypothetical protein
MCTWIDDQVTCRQGLPWTLEAGWRVLGSPQYGLDASQENAQVKGFGDVVVSAQLQPQGLIKLAPPRCDKNHWSTNALLKVTQSLQAIHAGQPYVEKDEIGWVSARQSESIFCIG